MAEFPSCVRHIASIYHGKGGRACDFEGVAEAWVSPDGFKALRGLGRA